ncbi:MAG TPA: TylF/MycF/NovP-related O-methyltransferase [Solirubrobacteraceae bacterium]|nr:TylF/MycF/NovP-related O-methyltransferase [Solirubrobacteraceae bacterium]
MDAIEPLSVVDRRGRIAGASRDGARALAVRARAVLLLSGARANRYIAQGPVIPYHRFRRATANFEFVRAATTELLAREIGEQRLPGSVAELGVFRGDYARMLNACFPDRALFLFDTFDGFDARDARRDAAEGLPTAPYPLPPTTAEIVRARLPHPDRARIRPGWFPESASGLERERFCFVHIDVGLWHATAAGLEWFHPRLVPGGYMMVADYNNAHTPGVRRAVREFTARTGSTYAVLPDFQGHAVIGKPPPG